MMVRDFCTPNVVRADAGTSLRDASAQMRKANVGALVVVSDQGGVARPIGILTDRDIVVAVIAVPGARPEAIRVGDAMSTDVVVAHADDGLFEAVARMSERAVRRLPVVGPDGGLVGIISLDDVLRVLAAELGQLAEALRWGRMRERSKRRA